MLLRMLLSLPAAALLAWGLMACSRQDGSETIIFVRISSTKAYSGVVSTVSPNGGKPTDVLSLGSRTAVESVSASALDGKAIVLAWQNIPSQRTPPHLFECTFNSQHCRRVLPETNNLEGSGFLSPDSQSVAVAMAAPDQPQRYSLWISNLATGQKRQLSDPPSGSWDTTPAWSPDGAEILFIRVRRSSDGNVHAALMKVNTATLETSQFLAEAEGVVVAAYSAEGKEIAFWSKNGLEVLTLANLNRTVVRSVGSLPGYQFYGGGGLGWSPDGGAFALALRNTLTDTYEVLTISRDGGRLNQLYTSSQFRIFSVAFVRRTSSATPNN